MSAAKRQNIALKIRYFQGDGLCDDYLNVEQCEFDSGDCCGENLDLYFCTKCECLDPDYLLFWWYKRNLSNDSSSIASCCYFFQFSTFINSKLSVDIVIIVVIQDFVLPEKKNRKIMIVREFFSVQFTYSFTYQKI